MPEVQKLVIRSGVKVEIANLTAGVPGQYSTFVPRGSVQVNDGIATATYTDFSSALDAIAAIVPDGDRTISITMNAYLMPADAAYETVRDAYKAREQIAVRITWTTRDGTASEVETYKGFLTNFGRTGNESGAAEVSLTFNATDDISTP